MASVQQHILERHIVQAVETIESEVDAQLHALDTLDEDDLEKIRRKRLDDMKKIQQKKDDWLQRGHGELREITEKDFFSEMKGEERMVCLFYRASVPCQAMEKHLGVVAKKHLETKFVKIEAEKAPFLAERLRIWMLPTLALIQHEKTTDYVVGLDDVGGTEDFDTSALEHRLIQGQVIFGESVPLVPGGLGSHGGGGGTSATAGGLRKGGHMVARTQSDEDSDFD